LWAEACFLFGGEGLGWRGGASRVRGGEAQ
jgi:hypothetical protein